MDVQNLWGRYLAETAQQKVSATSFGVWLIKNDGKADSQPAVSKKNRSQKAPEIDEGNMTTIFIARLYRFIKLSTKDVLQEKGLAGIEEFALIATLFFKPNSTKSALLRQSIIELTTGSEMLKRFVEKKIILAQTDKTDKRISRLSLSKKGNELFFSCAAALGGLEDALAPLQAGERIMLYNLLNKLDGFHSQKHNISQVAAIMHNSQQPLS